MLLGAAVNFATIFFGSLIGLALKKGIPERFRDVIIGGMAFCTVYVGITGLLKGKSTLVIVISIAIGAFIGELFDLEGKMNKLGDYVQSRFKGNDNKISQAFVTATLLYGVGAMAIVGSLQSGISGDHSTLFTKSILDGIMSIILASQLGFGVMLSAVPVFIYQGAITLLSGFLEPYLTETAIAEMTCSGSLLIMMIGFNLLGITKLKIVNYIPAIFISAVLAQIAFFY
ncbi:MAG: DUF554 domain-containing protein [Ruminococcaceae bacterium]|nr:DUF554 domain-containing protein [Oscillospiraceae bacterium]